MHGLPSLLSRLRSRIFEKEILEIFLIEKTYLDVGIELPQQTDLAVFLGHQRLLHGRKFDIKIAVEKVKRRGKGFHYVPVLIIFERKRALNR
jgi:hypothetical protein